MIARLPDWSLGSAPAQCILSACAPAVITYIYVSNSFRSHWTLHTATSTLHPLRPSASLPGLVMPDTGPYWSSVFDCRPEDPGVPAEDTFSMSVNQDIFNYFSRPEGNINATSFLAIYCLNPLGDDGCPFGLCPNPDIAGPLLRMARTCYLVPPADRRLTPIYQITFPHSVWVGRTYTSVLRHQD